MQVHHLGCVYRWDIRIALSGSVQLSPSSHRESRGERMKHPGPHCSRTDKLSAPCRTCGQRSERLHIVEEEGKPGCLWFYCPVHCPAPLCAALEKRREKEAAHDQG